MPTTVNDIFDILSGINEFFSVTFARRTSRRDGSAIAGDMRTMLCRTNVHKYKLGIIPDAVREIEDLTNGVLTVWSMDVYMRLRRNAVPNAGWLAWRRIDLVTISDLSILPEAELPPDFVGALHNIRNAYRAANMPRVPI